MCADSITNMEDIMEEKNQNTNEYTGEYGNTVEAGEDSQSSVYSYSYREQKSEATSSGDYHASEDSNRAAGWQDNRAMGEQTGNAGDSTGSRGWQAPPFEQMHESANQQNTDTQYAGQQNAGFQTTGPQNTGFQSNGPQNVNPQNGAGHGSPGRKSDGLTWKKVGVCASLAVVFGIVAAICFQGVCYFSSHVLGINVAALDTELAYTTDHVNYTKAVTDTAIGTLDVSGIVQHTMPSIVAITSTEEGENYYDLFGQYYQGQDTTSCGSGFIVGKNATELLIATNNHVIEGAKTISVQFIDDEVYEAKTKGTDSTADLAVVAVKLTDIKSSTMKQIRAASLGDSSESKVGEMVVAIGNALGYGQSVTVGYISAKDREITESSQTGNGDNKIRVIQTDAAINPGNSGGALLNMRGEVIGINSAKIADSAVEGVGYAIPISEATPIIDELMNKEVLTASQKGYLGISGKTVSAEAASYNVPEGVYVSDVADGGAADKAGIKQGDIITAINDVKVTTMESLKEKANSYKKGTKVIITLQRNDIGGYQEKKVEVILQGESSLNSLPNSTPGSRFGDGNSDDGQNGRDGDNGSGDNGDGGSRGDGSDDGGNNSDNNYDSEWGWPFPFGFGN